MTKHLDDSSPERELKKISDDMGLSVLKKMRDIQTNEIDKMSIQAMIDAHIKKLLKE